MGGKQKEIIAARVDTEPDEAGRSGASEETDARGRGEHMDRAWREEIDTGRSAECRWEEDWKITKREGLLRVEDDKQDDGPTGEVTGRSCRCEV